MNFTFKDHYSVFINSTICLLVRGEESYYIGIFILAPLNIMHSPLINVWLRFVSALLCCHDNYHMFTRLEPQEIS